MALQFWIPLTGNDAKAQYGVSGVSTNGTVNFEYGPLGTSAVFNLSTSYRLYANVTNFNYTRGDFSWAMWFKKTYDSSVASMWAFTVGRADAGGYGYGLRVISSSQVQCWFGNQTWNCNFADNGFHHIAFVKRGTGIRVYVDGTSVVDTQFTGSYPTYSDGNGLGIGCFHYNGGDIYPLKGNVADFRIYDHALSAKEAKELSEGLLLHYKLDNRYCTGMRNMYSGDSARGMMSGPFTRTKLANEDGYKYTYSYTGTGSNNWPAIYLGNLSKSLFTVGRRYFWSCKVRVNTWTAASMALRSANWGNDYTTGNNVVVANPSLADGKWHEYYVSEVISQTNYDNASFAPKIEFYCDNLNVSGQVYNFDLDIKELQIVEADSYPGWIDNSMTSPYITNCGIIKGLSNLSDEIRLTKNIKSLATGVVKLVPSVVHEFAYDFNQTGFFFNDSINIRNYAFTMSYWVKPHDTTNSTQHFLVGTFSSWPNNGIGIYRDAGQSSWNIVFKSSAESSYGSFGGQTVSYEEWHHFVLTWSGTVFKVYVDGTLKTTATYGAGGYSEFNNIYLGNSRFNNTPESETEQCAMSDFRLYTTCFDEAGVVSLYRQRASVDNMKGLHTLELANDNPGITKAGLVKANDFHEGHPIIMNGGSSYTPAASTTNACSANIVIQLNKYDTSVTDFVGRRYRMVFDVSWSGYSAGSTWYQGAVNDAWDGNNCFVSTANSVRQMQTNIASGASGTYHYDTIVTIDRAGKYKYYFQFRTDNSDGNASFAISNYCVYEDDASIGQNVSRFRNLVEY